MITLDAPAELLAQAGAFVSAQTGLFYPPSAGDTLARGLAAVAQERGFGTLAACVRWLLTPPVTTQHISILARHLTIGETYFFREQATLAALEQHILPALIEARRSVRRLRLWSAACCTGEEVYTLAIILHRLLPDWKSWDIRILGTDLNPQFLQQANAGEYREWSFRMTPPDIKERYFTVADGRYTIQPDLRHMVRFAPLNLAQANYPSFATQTMDMDIILCRNALMYFGSDSAAQVVTNFHHSLVDDGWLILSSSESALGLVAQYEAVHFPGAMLYKKRSAPAQRPAVLPGLPPVRAGRPILPSADPLPGAPGAHPARVGGASRRAAEPPPPWHDAQTLYQAGRYEEAGVQLEALLARGRADEAILTLLARVAANQGRLAAAAEWCARAIAADKLNPATHYLRATILQEHGALEEAVNALKRVLYLDPNFVLATFELGNLALALDRPGDAHKYFAATRVLLSGYPPDAPIPDSDGLTAGRLDTMAAAMGGVLEAIRR